MIKRREREGKREKGRRRDIERDREGERGRKRDREIMSRAREKKGGRARSFFESKSSDYQG